MSRDPAADLAFEGIACPKERYRQRLLQALKERDEAREQLRALREATPRSNLDVAADNSRGVQLIALERLRQIQGEGYSPEKDDRWRRGELAWAAMAYATPDDHPGFKGTKPPESVYVEAQPNGVSAYGVWVWPRAWGVMKDHPPERRLVIAGALIAAELDRRARLPKPLTREEACARLRAVVEHDKAAAEALDVLLGGGA